MSGFPLNRRFGFDRGFDTYDDHLPQGQRPAPHAPTSSGPPTATTDAALRWLEPASAAGSPPKPFFLWVHYYDPHAPYEPPAEFAGARRRRPTTARSRSWTRSSAASSAALEERRQLRRTLVLVTADHGESLGEHGEDTHGIFLYDSTLRVPFIVAGTGRARGTRGARRSRAASTSLPTLLDYAGLAAPEIEGRSLRPAASTARR